jgi:hypothetical protein
MMRHPRQIIINIQHEQNKSREGTLSRSAIVLSLLLVYLQSAATTAEECLPHNPWTLPLFYPEITAPPVWRKSSPKKREIYSDRPLITERIIITTRRNPEVTTIIIILPTKTRW